MSEAEFVKRLERLERENRKFKRAGLCVLVLVAVTLGLGAAHARPTIPQKIVAHEFDVLDASGKVRIRLSTRKDGWAMVQVLDTAGVVQAEMLDGPVMGPSVELGMHRVSAPPQGMPRGIMTSDVIIGDQPQLGPMITLSSPGGLLGPGVGIGVSHAGQPNVTLLDSKGRDRAGMSLSVSGAPNIELSDPQGYSMDLGSTSTVTPTTGQTEQTSAASIVMFGNDKKHHVIWQAPQ